MPTLIGRPLSDAQEDWPTRQLAQGQGNERHWLAAIKTAVLVLITITALWETGAHSEDAGENVRTSVSYGKNIASPGRYDKICQIIESAARENNLPADFFARVIWQESKFDVSARSSAGALGIAQFMPKTASTRGLLDPFDPLEALHESASYLRELKNTFGNLGLAAAAYNAGPGRLSQWLSGKGHLPGETVAYVRLVTGYSVAEWTSPAQDGVEIIKGAPLHDPTCYRERGTSE